MLSSRRVAQFGLASACLILVGSVAVLVVGAADVSQSDNKPAVLNSTRAQASNSIGNFEAQIPQPMVDAKH
jgi:hypothetical protein